MDDLPTYIPLEDAAQMYHLPRQTLTRAVEDGIIRAVKVGGRIAVAEEDIAAMSGLPGREEFEHLRGEHLSVPQAAREYNVPYTTLRGWIEYGYLPSEETRQGKLRRFKVDRADIAYLSTVYHRLKEKRGSAMGRGVLRSMIQATSP